jgi:hypothetical protein
MWFIRSCRTPISFGPQERWRALALANIHKFDLLVIDSPLRADVRMELLQAFLDQNRGRK